MRTLVFFFLACGAASAACVGDGGQTTTDGGLDAASDVSLNDVVAIDASEACATTCGGQCVDTTSDPQNCGGCGVTCKKASTSFACVQSKCGNVVTSVETSQNASCALLLEGTVWCWGDENVGETGVVGTYTPAPTKVAGLSNVTAIAGAASSWCALEGDGSVWCWGSNSVGQLAQTIGADPDCNGVCDPTPRQVTLSSKATQVVGGTDTFCAVVAGNVYCWGAASTGILGTTSATPSATPVKIPVFTGDVLALGFSFSDGGFPGVHEHACALRSDTSIWCWGENNGGQLGHPQQAGTPADTGCYTNAWCNPTPQPVQDGASKTITGFKVVLAGNQFSAAIKSDGTLWTWGSNGEGTLGNGTHDTNVFGSHSVPAQILTNAAYASVSELDGFVVDNGGTTSVWGANLNGSLGLGTLTVGTTCTNFDCKQAPATNASLAGAKHVSLRYESGLALMPNGDVLGWGINDYAQLGHAPNTNGDVTCGASSHCLLAPTALASTPW